MTQYLPPNLLALFAPRDPVPFLPPTEKLPHEKRLPPYIGVSSFLHFEDPAETPAPTRSETKDEKRERKRKERQEQVAYQLEQDLAMWDPSNDPSILGDPFKVLFVGRINYDTSESKLRREFEVYGPIKRLKMVYNRNNAKPRGYAFIEYEHERDMHSAYKHADGKKIDGRRVLVDVERGRTIKGWRPRRLGGGLGGTRKGGPEVCTKFSGREDSSMNRGRSRSRDRDRGGGRSRSRDRKPRIRSRSRDRGGGRRDRSGERPPRRPRGEDEKPDIRKLEAGENMEEMQVKIEDAKRRRKRSGSRGERRRSRSPRGDRRRRSRSRDRGDRRRRRDRDGEAGEGENGVGGVSVKKERDRGGYPGEGGEAPPPAQPMDSAPTDYGQQQQQMQASEMY